jgi:hypothetical protein
VEDTVRRVVVGNWQRVMERGRWRGADGEGDGEGLMERVLEGR